MDVNYFPGRIRLRDKIFRDQEIRGALVDAIAALGAEEKVSYKEKTGSVLIEYNPKKVDEEKFIELKPLLQKYRSAVLFYEPSKKSIVLGAIEEIKKRLLA